MTTYLSDDRRPVEDYERPLANVERRTPTVLPALFLCAFFGLLVYLGVIGFVCYIMDLWPFGSGSYQWTE